MRTLVCTAHDLMPSFMRTPIEDLVGTVALNKGAAAKADEADLVILVRAEAAVLLKAPDGMKMGEVLEDTYGLDPDEGEE